MIDRICDLLRTQPPVMADRGLLFGSGASVPSAADGWQPGALFQDTTNGYLYINEGSITSCSFARMSALTAAQETLLGATAGTVGASQAVIVDAYKTLRWGGFNTSAALTDAVPFSSVPNTWSDGQLDILSVFGGTNSDLTGLDSAKCGRFRHVVNFTGTQNAEIYGLVGQVVAKTVELGLYSAGLMGTIESNGGFHAGTGTTSSYTCHAGVIGRPGGASITVDADSVLAAVAALSNTSSITATGPYVGVYIAKCQSGTDAFGYGIKISDSASTTGIAIGSCTTGLSLAGTYSGKAISLTGTFSDHAIYIAPAATLGTKNAFRVGSWGSEAAYTAGAGLFRMYGNISTGTDATVMMFLRSLNTSLADNFAVQIYADSDATTPGPANVHAADFYAVVNDGKYIKLGTNLYDGLIATWHKVTAPVGAHVDGNAFAIFLDNQINTTVGGVEAAILSMTGGSKPDSWAYFKTTSSGYDQLLYFDSTFNSGAGSCVTTDAVPGTQDARVKVYYNGAQYYIALYR